MKSKRVDNFIRKGSNLYFRNRNFSTMLDHDNITNIRNKALQKYDITQVQQMEEDTVTQVDENDNVIGPMSKVNAHLRPLLDINKVPHRAFSLFLFNSQN